MKGKRGGIHISTEMYGSLQRLGLKEAIHDFCSLVVGGTVVTSTVMPVHPMPDVPLLMVDSISESLLLIFGEMCIS